MDDELISVVYMDDEGEMVEEKITKEEFDARFEKARDRVREYLAKDIPVLNKLREKK